MDREGFLETVRRQYIEDIQEAYFECEHGGDFVLDLPTLQARLGTLMKSAQVDGLPRSEFEELVLTTLPHLQGKIDLNAAQKSSGFEKKKAA